MAHKLLNVTAIVVIVIAAAAVLIEKAEAESHTVGGSSGWTNTFAADFYTSWAANHTFKVGDILVFEFTSGRHDVARLTKEAFDACNNTDLLTVPENKGPTSYSLNETGDYYFICAFPGHCNQGQKLSIKVTAETSGSSPADAPAPTSEAKTPSHSPSEAKTPSLSPPSTAGATAPTPQGSASSLASAFPTIFMSMAIALFYIF